MKYLGDKYKYERIIHFESDDAYGLIALNSKFAMRIHFTFEFIGNYSKEELKKKFPNTSIKPHTHNSISKSEKIALYNVFRKEKIKKILKSEQERYS